MNFDREAIFQLIYKKQWTELVRLLNERGNLIKKSGDEIVIMAIETFITQFIDDIKNSEHSNYISQLHMIFDIHRKEMFTISEKDFSSIVVELANYYKSDLNEAIYYAKFFPEHPVCADIIEQHTITSPQTIEHSQNKKIKITTKRKISKIDSTVSLFKSLQEKDFFLALCRVFPRLDVYPNVALSCLINYEAIKSSLSPEERDFFFKGIIDCVVFDRNHYKPIYFFELDSKYHDTINQKAKDNYKDNIISKAGQKIYRIRKTSYGVGIEEFISLINEILDAK